MKATKWYHEILWIFQLSCIIFAPLGFIFESVRIGFRVGVIYAQDNFTKCNREFKRISQIKEK